MLKTKVKPSLDLSESREPFQFTPPPGSSVMAPGVPVFLILHINIVGLGGSFFLKVKMAQIAPGPCILKFEA